MTARKAMPLGGPIESIGMPKVPNLPVAQRDARMKEVMAALTAKHGVGTVMRLNDKLVSRQHEVWPSGLPSLDLALGVGGWPRGRVIEMFGPEMSGKTTLALQAMAICQKHGGVTAFLDAEHAYDERYARGLGVTDPLISQPDYGEQVFEVMETMLEMKVDMIVVDSVAALVPKAELEGEVTDQHVGLQARMMSGMLRRMTAKIAKAGTTVIFINQLRVLRIGGYGNPEDTPGGKAMKYYATIRIDLRAKEKIKKGEEVIGHNSTIKVVKNKLAPPFRTADVSLLYGRGFWRAASVIDLAVEHGVVEKVGAWYSYDGQRLGQGRENTATELDKAIVTLDEIEDAVRKKLWST